MTENKKINIPIEQGSKVKFAGSYLSPSEEGEQRQYEFEPIEETTVAAISTKGRDEADPSTWMYIIEAEAGNTSMFYDGESAHIESGMLERGKFYVHARLDQLSPLLKCDECKHGVPFFMRHTNGLCENCWHKMKEWKINGERPFGEPGEKCCPFCAHKGDLPFGKKAPEAGDFRLVRELHGNNWKIGVFLCPNCEEEMQANMLLNEGERIKKEV